MSMDAVDQAEQEIKVEELREAVLKMEAKAAPVKVNPLEPTQGEKRQREEIARVKAPEVPEQVKRTQEIIASIHARVAERARLVADGNSKRVAYQRAADREQKEATEEIARMTREHEVKVAGLLQEFRNVNDTRAAELAEVTRQIEKIDASLEQLRKQLDVELGKVDPMRKAVTG